mmetsp:Transcript_107867/g.348164  ORF Transcript_107867/g.348164 Transcript_107867/m.348164 type:complete len:379 (-) Transcript_107867:710-1846(-)
MPMTRFAKWPRSPSRPSMRPTRWACSPSAAAVSWIKRAFSASTPAKCCADPTFSACFATTLTVSLATSFETSARIFKAFAFSFSAVLTPASSLTFLARESERPSTSLARSMSACSALATMSLVNCSVATTCASKSALAPCTSTTLLVSLPTSPTMTLRCFWIWAMLASAAMTSCSSSPILICESATAFWRRASPSTVARSNFSTSFLSACIAAHRSAIPSFSACDSTTLFVSLPISAVISMRCLRRSAFSASKSARLVSSWLRSSRMATTRASKLVFVASACSAIDMSSCFSASRVRSSPKSWSVLLCSATTLSVNLPTSPWMMVRCLISSTVSPASAAILSSNCRARSSAAAARFAASAFSASISWVSFATCTCSST